MMIWIAGNWDPDDPFVLDFREAIGARPVEECPDLVNILSKGVGAGDLLLLALRRGQTERSIEDVLALGARTVIYLTPEGASIRVEDAMGYCKRHSNVKDIAGASERHRSEFQKRLPFILEGSDRRGHYKIVLRIGKTKPPILVFPATPFDPTLDFRAGLRAGLDSRRLRLHDPGSQSSSSVLLDHVLTFVRQANIFFLNARQAPYLHQPDNPNVWLELGMAIRSKKQYRIFRHTAYRGPLPSDLDGRIYEEYERRARSGRSDAL